jgi:predicted transcriptional regulator
MKKPQLAESLSRRERQVMNILFRRGEATVAEILGQLPDPPSYSAVRSVLRVLTEKKLITHREKGPRYVYLPRVDSDQAADEALMNVVKTFFGGSPEAAATALLKRSDARVSKEALRALQERINAARNEGR